MNKKNLVEVCMEWSESFSELRNERVEMAILEMLQPPQKCESLAIKSYGGLKFPTWLGDSSFSDLAILEGSNCKSCTFLPPLGQLPFLKKLYIRRMPGIKSVGVEFLGQGFFLLKPFPSLKILMFDELLEWEDWSCSQGQEEIEGFPRLCELYMLKCPKLHGKLPNHLPSLTKLVINDSEQFNSLLPRLTALQELHLKGCVEAVLRNAVDLTSLTSLYICNISNLMHLPERFLQQLTQLKFLEIADFSELNCLWKNELRLEHLICLQRLVVCNCPSLVTMLEQDVQLPIKLEYLEVEYCHNLERLPIALSRLRSLGELTIKDCPKLVSFSSSNFPSMLKALVVRRCNFGSLPAGIIHNADSPLEYLYISGCYDFTSFSGKGDLIPTTFQQLTIDNCPNLEYLPPGLMHSSNSALTVLEIFDCLSLSSFPRGQLPTSLKTFTIWNCTNLESLAEVMRQDNMFLESFRVGKCTSLRFLPNGLQKMKYLEYLEIDLCPGLESFAESGFPSSCLKKVYISNCENLKSLPYHMQNLTCLQELHISDCPLIEFFPKRGFPSSLVSLEIRNCESVPALSDWGLHRLTTLEKLSITNGCSELSSFPEWLLPPTLTSLHIEKLINLECMSNWLQNLSSLQDLKIKECRKLRSLPVDALPATLARLEISDCPILEQQCERDWSKIDHIPCILM